MLSASAYGLIHDDDDDDGDDDDDIVSGKQPTSYFIRVRICFQGGTLVATVVTPEKGLL